MKQFSERMGFVKAEMGLQSQSMNKPLRNSLWNLVLGLFEETPGTQGSWTKAATFCALEFLRIPVDELPRGDELSRGWFKGWFYKAEWYAVYDFLEFLLLYYPLIKYGFRPDDPDPLKLTAGLNRVLERESAGYRVIEGMIAPITSAAESDAIADALDATTLYGLRGAHTHIATALGYMAKRPEPDHRNATKEAISAVESVAKQISGSEADGLTGALKALSAKIHIHHALSAAFVKLYGYSSDEKGIRHPLIDDPQIGFDEAKFMVVSCSAFVHFLVQKAAAAGLVRPAK